MCVSVWVLLSLSIGNTEYWTLVLKSFLRFNLFIALERRANLVSYERFGRFWLRCSVTADKMMMYLVVIIHSKSRTKKMFHTSIKRYMSGLLFVPSAFQGTKWQQHTGPKARIDLAGSHTDEQRRGTGHRTCHLPLSIVYSLLSAVGVLSFFFLLFNFLVFLVFFFQLFPIVLFFHIFFEFFQIILNFVFFFNCYFF